MAKAKADLSLTGAVNEVYDFFFETADDIIQAITPTEVKTDGIRNDVEQPGKRAKPVGDTFITEEKGKKDKRGKGSDGIPKPDSEELGADDGAEE